MLEQPPPQRMSTALPLKGIAFCAVAMGISFGLCTASYVAGARALPTIAAAAFSIAFTGVVVCLIWLVVAVIVNSFPSRTE